MAEASARWRVGWGLADQGLSSLGNVAVFVLAAQSLDASGFGAFALAMTTYGLAVGVARAVATDPLLVRTPVAGAAEATGTALVVGFGFGCLVGLCGLVLSSAPLVVLGLWLPILTLQDALRFVALERGRPAVAFASDALWSGCEIVVLAAVVLTGRASAAWLLGGWAASAAPAALVAARALGVRPKPAAASAWVAEHRDLAPRFAVEFLTLSGAGRLLLYMLALLTTVAEVGVFRAGQVLYGPVNVLVAGAQSIGLTELRRMGAGQEARLHRVAGLVGLTTALAALAWTALLLASDVAGRLLIGGLYPPARTLVIPLGIQQIASCIMLGPFLRLRASAAARESLRLRLRVTLLVLTVSAAGALAGGAYGAAVGMAAAQTVAAALVWRIWLPRGAGGRSARNASTPAERSAVP